MNNLENFFLNCNEPLEKIGVLLKNENYLKQVLDFLYARKMDVYILDHQSSMAMRDIIRKQNIDFVVSETFFLSELSIWQWECEKLDAYLLVDNASPYQIAEKKNKLMNKVLWDVAAVNATDAFEGGGWIDSYERTKFSLAEMDEFVENVVLKLQPYLSPQKRILEIGCSSGLTMFRLAPLVKEYYAIDLSKVIIRKNLQTADKKNLTNLKLFNVPAHCIDSLAVENIDIVIMNSVVQCFSGYNYYREVLKKSINLLDERGVIFIGDVMDLSLKDELMQSVRGYKEQHPNANSKLNFRQELFYANDFFYDMPSEFPEIASVQCTNKIGSIKNELLNYRYDVVMSIDKKLYKKPLKKKKRQYGIVLNG